MVNNLSVYLPGHADTADSYGLIGCQLVRYLTRTGIYTNLFAMGKRQMDSQDAELAAITAQPIRPSLGGVFLGYPTNYAKHANPLAHIGPRVCVTMFESSRIPDDWVEPLNGMDAVIVPSHFCADVFRDCGVTAPVHVVPLGVGEVYQYAERPVHNNFITTSEQLQNRPLTFLAFMDRGQRKGGMVAYKAFCRAFGEDMNYRLLLKARARKNKDVSVTAAEPNVELIDRDMDEQELYELYLSADVLINPHKGEGFGLIPREFAATGGIALTTDWSGTADDLDLWGYPLPYTLEPATWTGHKRLEGQDLGEWAACDPDAVARELLDVAERRWLYRHGARYAAIHVQRLYSWRAFAEQVLSIWKEAADGNRVRATAA